MKVETHNVEPDERSRGRVELIGADPRRLPREQIRRLVADDQMPDVLAFDDALRLECVDERYFAAIPGVRGGLLRRLPLLLAQCVEVFRRRRDLQLIVSWSEQVGAAVALTLLLTRRRPAHVGVFSWVSKPKKAAALRLLRSRFDGLVIPGPTQREFAVSTLGIPADLAPAGVGWGVDTRFWRPTNTSGDMICCVGREMRDYATFVDAVRPLGIRCHIAAGGVQGTDNPWLRLDEEDLPAHVTLSSIPPIELRALYARSRFVVVPLLPTDTDNGTTTVLESFAMGRAVICTKTEGRATLLKEGVNCLLVPPQDSAALRAAIERLWSDVALCQRLGEAGRALVESDYTFEQFIASVDAVARSAIARRKPVLTSDQA